MVYFWHKDSNQIEKLLNEELINLQSYCYENELVLNLKKGKTETILFGTAKRLFKKNTIQLQINGQPIYAVESYCYLGNVLDQSLSLNENFDRAYKRASGRLSLLSKMRQYVNTKAANEIFEKVILPLLIYSSSISLHITATQKQRLSSIERRAKRIIGEKTVKCIEKCKKRKACLMVRKCLDGKVCSNFDN